MITKAGYASIVVEPDRRTLTREIDIRLDRGAVMSGRIIEQGMPAIGARVIARRVDDSSNTKPTYEAETDDLGEYRIGGLPAGQYTVTAHTRLKAYASRRGWRLMGGRPGDRLASSAVFPGNDFAGPAGFEACG